MNVTLYNDDVLKVLNNFNDESIDLCVTDCPYHIIGGGCTQGAFNSQSGILNRDFSKQKLGDRTRIVKNNTKHIVLEGIVSARNGKLFEFNDIQFSEWLPELYRVMKNNSHTYIMINARNLCELQTEAEKVGFQFQQLLVWAKNNCTPNRYYLNQCEFVLMLRKGGAKNINNMSYSNLLKFDNVIGNKLHPTQKPIELMRVLVENSSKRNDVVLDCFMGSGTTGLACKSLERNFIGIEIDEKYFNIAKERLENEPLQKSIFDYL